MAEKETSEERDQLQSKLNSRETQTPAGKQNMKTKQINLTEDLKRTIGEVMQDCDPDTYSKVIAALKEVPNEQPKTIGDLVAKKVKTYTKMYDEFKQGSYKGIRENAENISLHVLRVDKIVARMALEEVEEYIKESLKRYLEKDQEEQKLKTQKEIDKNLIPPEAPVDKGYEDGYSTGMVLYSQTIKQEAIKRVKFIQEVFFNNLGDLKKEQHTKTRREAYFRQKGKIDALVRFFNITEEDLKDE